MNYCVECGEKLVPRALEGEGIIPYCPACEAYRFPIFNVAVSMVVLNSARDKVLLIRQYGRDINILVAGYINKGESAECAVAREIAEEVGLRAVDIEFNKSEYFAKSNTLMLNFSCAAADDELHVNEKEVDHAQWYSIEDGKRCVADGSLAERFLLAYLEKRAARPSSPQPLHGPGAQFAAQPKPPVS